MLTVIEGINRDKIGRNFAKKSRGLGFIPAVIYGDKYNHNVNLIESQAMKVLRQNGETGLIHIKVGNLSTPALIKEVQRHPISGEILHIDLKPVNENTRIKTKVPINFINFDNISKMGKSIQAQKHEVEIECTAKELPKFINIDVSKCDPEDNIRVRNIDMPGGINLTENLDDVVATFIHTNNTLE